MQNHGVECNFYHKRILLPEIIFALSFFVVGRLLRHCYAMAHNDSSLFQAA
ncbi:MAG: hypothetical protein J5680_03305 [Neisseriaceae bacterium]|nr:hypothetical protein [Neisseriaceae bacterium]